MKKDLIYDYLGYIAIRVISPLIRALPLSLIYPLASLCGVIFYTLNIKQRTLVYANLKEAFSGKFIPSEIKGITKRFYINFSQNIMELFFLPKIDKDYIKKYFELEGEEYLEFAFKSNRPVILLGVHEGSWEISNAIISQLKFPIYILIREQRFIKLNKWLNFYRRKSGSLIIERRNQIRQIIQILKEKKGLAMTFDQGGKNGYLVDFFGKPASFATGAIKLALKYDALIIPGFYVRKKGPFIKVILDKPINLKKTGNLKKDIEEGLNILVKKFERYIVSYPWEYLWSYKIWKYTNKKKVLILNDQKIGHLRQSQAVSKILKELLNERGFMVEEKILTVKFKNKFSKSFLIASCGLASFLENFSFEKNCCQGCLWCLRKTLIIDTYQEIVRIKPDYIISCGSSLVAINYILSRENLSRSIVILKPSIFSLRRFNLVIMPMHDKPPQRENCVITQAALNLIDSEYLRRNKELLEKEIKDNQGTFLGLLLGGDAKNFKLREESISEVIRQIKLISQKLNLKILVTTSRRTPLKIEKLVKEEFSSFSNCKLLVIVNEYNPEFSLGGILGLADFIVVSPESISMISEAINSGKYVFVFKDKVDNKHNEFLERMSHRYIYLYDEKDLAKSIEEIYYKRPKVNLIEDKILVKKGLEKII